MRLARVIMGMPIEVELVGTRDEADFEEIFSYLRSVDEQFSPYKAESEVSRIDRGEIPQGGESAEMKEVLEIAERTKVESHGYFNVWRPDGHFDPSGIVKGWALRNAARRYAARGYENYAIVAGGDIALAGTNAEGKEWSVGIKNPKNTKEIVKVIYPRGAGVATSGSYERGAHIYNPHTPADPLNEVASITVIGPDVLEADRFATAAFAMGKRGISFIEALPGFEGYMIDTSDRATLTSGFHRYT